MWKRKGWRGLILALLMLTAGCGGAKTPDGGAEQAGAQAAGTQAAGTQPEAAGETQGQGAKEMDVKLAYPSTADFTDIASLIVWNDPPEGLNVSYEFMAKADIAIQGVVQGNFDIGAAPATTVLSAIDAGLPIKIIAEQMKNEFALLTPSTITSPDQLEGKRLAIHGPNTLTDALVRSTIKEYGLKNAQVLTIPGSEVRAQALLNGEIDATPAEIADVANIRKTEGDKYHILVAYPQDYPLINGTVFFTTDKAIQEKREDLKVFVRAILEGYRNLYDNPDVLKQNAGTYLKNMDQSTVDELAQTYIDNKILDVNGGISKENGDFTISFNKEMGLIKGDKMTYETAYDSSIVDEVLQEIGKE